MNKYGMSLFILWGNCV